MKIEKSKLKSGMILEEDVLGNNNITLKKGTELTDRFITILKNEILFPMTHIPVTDDSYNSILLKSSDDFITDVKAVGKVLSTNLLEELEIQEVGDKNYVVKSHLSNVKENISIPGSFLVSGNLENSTLIHVNGDLTVVGDVVNTNIVAKGHIKIQGQVKNTQNSFKINSFGDFTAGQVHRCLINADSIKIFHTINNSEVVADKNIQAPSAMHIINSKLQAGTSIILGSVKQETTLIIFSEKQMNMVKHLLEIEKTLKNFEKEMEPLKQSIKVFQILKDKVNELPESKRNELINNLKTFKQKLEEKKLLQNQFVTLKVETAKIKKSREHNPIVIEEEIEKGTKVIIDNSSFVVQMKEKGVVFYKKSMIIMGKKDKEWGKII